jgi:hypothetical protein
MVTQKVTSNVSLKDCMPTAGTLRVSAVLFLTRQ